MLSTKTIATYIVHVDVIVRAIRLFAGHVTLQFSCPYCLRVILFADHA